MENIVDVAGYLKPRVIKVNPLEECVCVVYGKL